MLVIFIRYTNADLMPGQPAWPNSSEKGELPRFAKGENNELFAPDTSWFERSDMKHNLSEYYFWNSGASFKVTADIYPIQVPVRYRNPRRGNYYGNYVQMNQEAIDWIAENDTDFDWSKYDNRENLPRYKSDNSRSEPDGILDYVIINHRAPGSNGFGNTGNLNIPGTDFRINAGHTAATCYADAKHNWMYNTHEFAHNLFQCPHLMGANTSDGNRYYVQKGWGMMAAWHAPFYTVNAWEAWWLGWMEAQEVKKSGRYQLGDFLTDRDVIRIPIPDSKDYLWIENHQKRHYWDHKLFYSDTTKDEPQVSKGIYMYVVSGRLNDRNNPSLSPFNQACVNAIKMMNAEGNFDYTYTSQKAEYWQAFEKGRPNPFSGQNDFQFIKVDLDSNGQICVPFMHGNNDGKSCDQIDIWAEMEGGKPKLTYGNTGNENDALDVGDEVGLSGVFPVSNYPIYRKKADSLDDYIIAGITISIMDKNEDGSYELDINLNDWKLRKDQRWCGTLKMQKALNSAQVEFLEIMPKTELRLEKSGTPNRQKPHPETNTYISPTRLLIPPGRGIYLRKNSVLYLDKTSSIIFQGNSQLVIEKGAKVILEGKLIFLEDAQLIQKRKRDLKLRKGEIIFL